MHDGMNEVLAKNSVAVLYGFTLVETVLYDKCGKEAV